MSKFLTKLFPNIIKGSAMDKENTTEIKEIVKKNTVQIALYIVGLTFAIVNLWLASKLSPLVQDIKLLNTRVYALELKRDKDDEDTKVLLQEIYTIKGTVDIMNKTVERIENKLDQHLIDE